MQERKLLRLLEAALNVSEYVDKVDVLSYRSKTQRMHAQLKDICAILSGLLVASDYKQGQKLIQNRSFVDNASFFQDCFEVGRRHKVMNPEKMRGEYGKLVYLLMDSQLPEVQQLLEFQCAPPPPSAPAPAACGCRLGRSVVEALASHVLLFFNPRLATQCLVPCGRARSTVVLCCAFSSNLPRLAPLAMPRNEVC